jgi:hypothetical protein
MENHFTHKDEQGDWCEDKGCQRAVNAKDELLQAYCTAKEQIYPYYINKHKAESNKHSTCHESKQGNKYHQEY